MVQPEANDNEHHSRDVIKQSTSTPQESRLSLNQKLAPPTRANRGELTFASKEGSKGSSFDIQGDPMQKMQEAK